jgi:4a-hydroxytetrahydrobiopterin dehydratase
VRLSNEEIQQRLGDVPDWSLDDKFISRRFKFRSFVDAMAFANKVAEIAEARNHHPFISIDYKVVTLRLTSWHAGGLTDADFDEAKAFDLAYEGMNQNNE